LGRGKQEKFGQASLGKGGERGGKVNDKGALYEREIGVRRNKVISK